MNARRYGRGTARPAPMPVTELRQRLAYNPETGIITWLDCTPAGQGARRMKRGAKAGCQGKWGYIVIRIGKVLYPAHRLAWYLHTGEWPPHQVDHINEVKSDNRIANLRLATQAENTSFRHQNRILREGAKPIPKLSEPRLKNDRVAIAELRQLLRYDPETGIFVWNKERGCNFNKRAAGTKAGGIKGGGYVKIKIDGIFFAAHRLAFALMTGEWPDRVIDHINGIKHDNRWSNLRLATFGENIHARAGKGSSTGYRGVYPNGNGYRAKIMINRQTFYGPTQPTIEEAYADYCALAIKHRGEFARLT